MALRAANDADWRTFWGLEPPPHWIGFTCEVAGRLEGFGGVYEADDGRWWVTFKRLPGVTRNVTAHRAARMTLECVKAAGVTVHALAETDIPGAEFWLRRLGFVETDEMIGPNTVWTWK